MFRPFIPAFRALIFIHQHTEKRIAIEPAALCEGIRDGDRDAGGQSEHRKHPHDPIHIELESCLCDL